MLTPESAIDTINITFGRHPGYRALHARGTVCTGTFVATPEAAALTRAAHMQGRPVAVTARLSNGSGDPEQPDFAPDVRGFAVGFEVSDGVRTDIVAQSAPRFPVRTPEAFIELIAARRPGAAGALRVPAFLARHPRALPRLASMASVLKPPASYAVINYYAIHAFRWLDAAGGSHHVRYTLVPQAAAETISKAEARAAGPGYLQQDIAARIARGPVRFSVRVQVADEGDSVDDPSADWPASRRTFDAGTIELTAVVGDPDPRLIFDPVRVIDGIELSNDPVLRFRAAAYSVSYERRTT